MLHSIAVSISIFLCVAVCFSLCGAVRYIIVCCSMLQCGAVYRSVYQYFSVERKGKRREKVKLSVEESSVLIQCHHVSPTAYVA